MFTWASQKKIISKVKFTSLGHNNKRLSSTSYEGIRQQKWLFASILQSQHELAESLVTYF